MKKKYFRRKKSISPKLTEEEAKNVKASIINAVIQTFGYNPEKNYTIPNNFYHSDLAGIPIILHKLQTTTIFISDKLRDEFYSCPKYIYKIDEDEITNSTSNNRTVTKLNRKTYHIIGKTSLGYVPFKLFITAQPKKEDYYRMNKMKEFESVKSLFAVMIKGQNYIILDRIDNNHASHKSHTNKYFNAKRKIFEENVKKRIPNGAHKHEYSEEELLYTYNKCLQYQGKNSKKNILKFNVLRESDAIEINKIPYNELLNVYLLSCNIGCFSNFNKNASLSQIFDTCNEIENKFYKQFEPHDNFEKNLLRVFITGKNINKIEHKKQSLFNLTDNRSR